MKKINRTLIGFIALLAVMIFFVTAGCEKSEKEKKISGTVTADTEGTVLFKYSRTQKDNPDFCTFTTDLPTPADLFVLTIVSGETTAEKVIEGLTSGQQVKWTATVAGKPLNHGSGNFVHIIND